MSLSYAHLVFRQTIAMTFLSLALIHSGVAQELSTGKKAKVLPAQKKELQKLQPAQDTAYSHASKVDAAKLVATQPAQQPHMALRAGHTVAQIGDVVKFGIKHTFAPDMSRFRFLIDYGDRSKDLLGFDNPEADHRFWSKGTFNVVASIVLASDLNPFSHYSQFRDSISVNIIGFSLTVEPEVGRVGEDVKFIVPVDATVGGRMFRFNLKEIQFVSPWSASSEFHHVFEQPGIYTVFAEIGRESQDSKKLSGRVVSVAETPQREYRILPQIPKTVVLQPDRKDVTVGTPLGFTASVDLPSDDVRYQFDFEDGDPLTWQSSKRATHQFKSARQYKVQVVAIYLDSKLVSEPVFIEVQPQRPTQVFLRPDRNDVTVGTPVVFTASVDHPSDQLRYRFHFDDGDSSEWQASDSTRHMFKSARKYMVTVDAYYPKDVLSSKPVPIVVNPGEPPRPRLVGLQANRTDVLVDKIITFTARVDHPSNKVNYRFIFGDGDTSTWHMAISATHRYNGTGQFMASVEASFAHDTLRSATIPIRVSRIPMPLWVWIAAGVVLSAAIGSGVRPVREWIFGPRVTILVKSDKRPPTVESLTPPTIDVRVILRSKLPEARVVVRPNDNVLIKSIGRKHA